MTFKSILFPTIDDDINRGIIEEPTYFKDLNLNQIIEDIIGNRKHLKTFFYTPLQDINVIQYRHEIMMDFECETLFKRIKSFVNNMNYAVLIANSICENLSKTDNYYCNYVIKGRLLEAVQTYCKEIDNLACDLTAFNLKSCGLYKFREYISSYAIFTVGNG